MTFQGVPWAIGHEDALNPVEAGRLLAYVASYGSRGILLPDDCKVTPMDVPEGRVRIGRGSLVIPNGAVGGSGQTYLARNPDPHPVVVPPTDGSGSRSDLVYVRIADPQYQGQPEPADPSVGPYVWPERVAGVAPSTTTLAEAIAQGLVPAGTTGVELARVDLPASTGTVQAQHIVDLRRLANPRSSRRMHGSAVILNRRLTTAAPGWQQWPANPLDIDIPEWATKAVVRAEVANIAAETGLANGSLRVRLGTLAGAGSAYSYDNDRTVRASPITAGFFDIPATMRGTRQQLYVEGNRGSTSTGWLNSWSDGQTYLLDVGFSESL